MKTIDKQEQKINRRRLRSSYFSTVVSIFLVLFMLGILMIIILSANKISDYVKENITVSIIIKEDAKEVDVRQFQKLIEVSPYAKCVTFVDKDMAANQLKEELGEDFVSFLGYNPLLASIDINLKSEYANNDSINIIEGQLKNNDVVKEVFYQKDLIDLVNENIKKISLFILGFSILLLTVAIALINNTIRLSVYARRFLIRTMQLVGATNWFIQKPFIIKGVLQGIVASFMSMIMLIIFVFFSTKELPELRIINDFYVIVQIFLFVLVLGIIIAAISTYFAVRKYLKLEIEKFY